MMKMMGINMQHSVKKHISNYKKTKITKAHSAKSR